MSFWSRVVDTLVNLAKPVLKPDSIDKLKGTNRQVAFTIALIALSAKMAKADGQVTADEVMAFKSICRFSPKDEKHVAKLFNLMKESVAGFEQYANSVAHLYQNDPRVREDVLEGLFHIANADGHIKPAEQDFLWTVNQIFGLSERNFSQRLHRFTQSVAVNPYKILGVDPAETTEAIKKRWKMLVKQSHPDLLIARGAPPEAAKLAQDRVADYNSSWDEIRRLRGI